MNTNIPLPPEPTLPDNPFRQLGHPIKRGK